MNKTKLTHRFTKGLHLFVIATMLARLPLSTAPAALSNYSSLEPDISAEQAIALAVNDLTATDGGYQLCHPRHTATFTAEGLTFTPRRGGPEWHWQLTHVGRGAVTVPLREVDVGAVVPMQAGRAAVAYLRGRLTERYLAQADSIEQQFVIPQPLLLGGADLVIEGVVACEGEFESWSGGWLWRSPEGVVSLGDVRVYDATGVALPAEMTVRAEGTRIMVDGVALARAAYPVTVGPEVGTNDFRISDAGGTGDANMDGLYPAVAYNSTNNEYLVVWQASDTDAGLAGGEKEIFGQRINAATGAEVGTNDFRISDAGGTGDRFIEPWHPAVAYNSTNNEYLVVWHADDTDAGIDDNENEIFGQRIDANGNEVGANDFRISDAGDGPPNDMGAEVDAVWPGVAYNSTNNEYLVVWEADDTDAAGVVDNEWEIFGQRIYGDRTLGDEVGTNDFRISDAGGSGDADREAHYPAVAYNRTSNQYLVVWNADDTDAGLAPFEDEIFGQRINGATGVEVGTNDFRISDAGGTGGIVSEVWRPAVAYNSTNNEYLVVW
jgi:hypothetical protein